MRSLHRFRLAGAAAATAIAVTAPIAAAPAHAAPAPTLPALPAPLNVPGASNALSQALQPGANSSLLGGGSGGGGALMGADGRTNINLPLVPQGGVRKQFTNAPAVEVSTKPGCAPFMLVAVPGTFEINRDDDPNKPVGLLKKLVDPLEKALGNRLSVTMINYDADAGVNGVGYNKSVDGGTKKTIATISDIASRCANASIILSGYSQGADVAGDAATAIGNRRTAVDPRRVAAVALFADPQRADNSNVIAGTNQSRPDIPAVLQNAIGQAASDPSFAQLQLQLTNGVQSLLTQTGLAGGTAAVGSTTTAGAAGSTSTPNAGQAGAGAAATSTPQAESSTPPESSVPLDAPTATSDAPSAGDAATPSAGMAGAAAHGDMHVQLAEYSVPAGRAPLSSDGDSLRPYKNPWPTDVSIPQAGTGNSSTPGTKPLTIVSPDGEVKLVSALTDDERNKYASAGWLWNRTDQQKDQRRKVIQDLYLLNSPECSGKTLQACQDTYVDARSGQTHSELLVPSSQLVAARDKAAAAADNGLVPAGAYDQIQHCLTLNADACRDYFATQIGAPPAPAPAAGNATSYSGLVASGGTSFANLDAKTKETLSRAQFFTENGTNTPVVQLALRNQGKKLSNNDSRTTSAAACQNVTTDQLGWDYQLPDGSGKGWKYATSGDSSNEWLTHVWWRATYGEKGKRLIDLSDDDLLKHGNSPDCAGWIGLTAKAFLDKYKQHQIVYNDDKFVAPNETGTAAANPAARKDLARNLYLYGGCGPFDATDAITKDAPNGPWTLGACVNEVTGRTSSLGKRSDQQIGQLVLKAKTKYQQSRPDWTNAVLTRGDLGFDSNNAAPAAGGALSPDRRDAAFGCDQLPARLCSVFKTSINGPKDAPSGVTSMVLPHFPDGGDGKLTAPDGPSERAKNVPAEQAAQKYGEGWRWLTPEVDAAVTRLDAAAEQLTTLTPADQNAVPGVTTLIKKSTPSSEAGTSRDGEAGAPIGSVRNVADIPGKNPNPYLYHGWVWGRTSAEDQKRPALLYNLYALGGCGAKHELTWKECYSRYTEANSEHPYAEYATTNDELTTTIGNLRKNQATLEWDANLKGRTDLMKDCADKPVWDGQEGDGSCAKKNGGTPEQNAGADTTDPSPTTESPTTTPQPTDEPNTTTDAPAPNADNAAANGSSSDTGTSDDGATANTTTPQITRVDMSAGADSTTAEQSAGQAATSSSTSSLAGGTSTDSNADGGLAQGVSNLITGAAGATDTTAATTAASGTQSSNVPSGGPVNVAPITQRAVAGGGLAGPRDADFGELKGRVVEFCVPGDLVCSLPANSQLARDLTQFAKNVSFDFPDMLTDEGATKMGGLIALQALNNVADVTGLPRTKLSADTLQALVNLAAGGAMLAAQQPAGAALVADGVSKLPNALPELFAQLRDVPALLRGLPTAGESAMKNTGLDKLLARINGAFQQAGMTSPLDVQKYPEAISALMQGLLKDNTGLMKMVTDPKYWQANAHGLYPELKVSGGTNSVAWAQQWIDQLAKLAGLTR
ncbi:cutinase family protein [Gordonia otitidis]|uniref:Cutinase n=1 Tax=Gordonia otitidis (strain DSM 44809 / CCUG 52243 / JCM 12355 / NBRC 100426 / IFM 10032) TaxID=1108044 RepID=H5TS56_GORO1|nr:cutinase family protein [Gordonia otitidis]GAB36314.1 hypothetical protein GOOTI_206_00470 [Gordonia otitidis NBRC 100426]